MNFLSCVDIHLGNILYKYGWNHSLDNKIIEGLETPMDVDFFVMLFI